MCSSVYVLLPDFSLLSFPVIPEWKFLSGWQVTGVPSACVWCGSQTISDGLFGRGKGGHSVSWVSNIVHVFSGSPLPCAVGRVCSLPVELYCYTQEKCMVWGEVKLQGNCGNLMDGLGE